MSAPVDVLGVLADHAKLWGSRGNTGYEGDLILARAAVAELVAAADHLLSPEAAGFVASMDARKRLMDALARFGGAE